MPVGQFYWRSQYRSVTHTSVASRRLEVAVEAAGVIGSATVAGRRLEVTVGPPSLIHR